jgi:hypothetical protein
MCSRKMLDVASVFQTPAAHTKVSHGLRSTQSQRRRQGRPPSRSQAQTRNLAVTAGALSHGKTAAHRVPAHRLRAYQPASPVNLANGAQVRTTALVAGCKRASPSRCVLCSVTHLWTGFVTHVDVCYKDAFSRARGQSAPRPARRDDLREKTTRAAAAQAT